MQEETVARLGEPISDLSEEQCKAIAAVLHRKYSMFAGTTVGDDEPFNVSLEVMQGIVMDTWFIVSGTLPLEVWREDDDDQPA